MLMIELMFIKEPDLWNTVKQLSGLIGPVKLKIMES
jgi:hypothetical protein